MNQRDFFEQLEKINRDRLNIPEWTLNEDQKRAIEHGEGPLWITAGPGSGKTEVLVSRALKLILVDGVEPGAIIVTTFTEKAAESMKERLVDRFEAFEISVDIDLNDIYVGTLHSLCNDLMHEYRYPDFTNVELLDETGQELFMYDNSDFVNFIHSSGKIDPEEWESISEDEINTGGEWRHLMPLYGWGVSKQYGPNKWQATSAAQTLLDRASQFRVDTEQMKKADDFIFRAIGEGLEHHREILRTNHRCDFSRLLERFIEFLEHDTGQLFLAGEGMEGGVEYLLVDEYQDTNPLQEELYFRIVEGMSRPNITVVGDDDQALYRFRGGTVECLIQFPRRVKQKFGVAADEIQLKTNYRSVEDILGWFNRYIENQPMMREEGARSDNKEPMIPGLTGTGDETGVRGVFGGDHNESAKKVAELIDEMNREGYINDYSQIALLFHTTRESKTKNAGPYVRALRERDIPVYNPRNKRYLEQEEIILAIGAVIQCLDPELEGLNKIIRGRLKGQIEEWCDDFQSIAAAHSADNLIQYVSDYKEKLECMEAGENLNVSIDELIYRVLSFEPFTRFINDSMYPARAERLGRLTGLFDSFARVSGKSLLRKSGHMNAVSYKFLQSFYWGFCGMLNSSSMDDPENMYEQIPKGYVQVMTVHQAKGLEFPIVFAGSLEKEPRDKGSTHWIEDLFEPYANINPPGETSERSERDLIRQYYVAYSRAESALFLMGKINDPSHFTLGYEENGEEITIDYFDEERNIETPWDFLSQVEGPVADFSTTDLKRRYSITGDVLMYRLCKRQYGFFNELGFVPSYEANWSFGRLVHETLDRAHRHYRGELPDTTEGELPEDEHIEDYFTGVMNALRAQSVYKISKEAAESVKKRIQKFNRTVGPELYPRVRDTEHHLQSTLKDYILEGVVDVLVGDDGCVEIWDYKGSKRPSDDAKFDNYDSQLKTYAELYHRKNGEYPERGVIYFVSEDDADRAKYTVEFSPDDVKEFMEDFTGTVENIEEDREQRKWLQINQDDAPAREVCDSCGIRFNCPAREEDYNLV